MGYDTNVKNLYFDNAGNRLGSHGSEYIITLKDARAALMIKGTEVAKEVKNTAPIIKTSVSDQILLEGQDIALSFDNAFFDADDNDKLIYNI